MNESRFNELSSRQRECLRLVARGYNTKEIAIELRISPETARDHIDAARRKLGADRRMQAARLLLEFETRTPPSEGPHAMGMAGTTFAGHPVPVSETETGPQGDLRDVATIRYHAASSSGRATRWPFRTPGRSRNDLTWYEQIAWAMALAIGSMVAVHEASALLR